MPLAMVSLFTTHPIHYFFSNPVIITGVHATLYFYTLSFLLQSLLKRGYGPRHNARSIGTWIMIVYITTNFIIGSIGNAINIKFNEEQFIDDRDFPGGPVAYSRAADSNRLNSIGFCLYVINTWLQDGLLVCLTRIPAPKTNNLVNCIASYIAFG